MDRIKSIERSFMTAKAFPKFKAGDNITVNYKIIEGAKERIQPFRGDVIQLRGTGLTATFTVRKVSNGVGVERIFPYHSPNINGIELNKAGKVRRSRIFYQRALKGKKARILEKREFGEAAKQAANKAEKQAAKKAAKAPKAEPAATGTQK